MKLSWFGRLALALFASLALGLGMSACGGGTIAYLWVLGQQYNQIASFKVDDFTGNLTQTPHQPFCDPGYKPGHDSRQGWRPLRLRPEPGHAALTCTSDATCKTQWTGSGISVFTVGGDGSLTYLQTYDSQGFEPVWMQFDATNRFSTCSTSTPRAAMATAPSRPSRLTRPPAA